MMTRIQRARWIHRTALVVAVTCWLPACALWSPARAPHGVAPETVRSRVERVEPGQTLREVREILGREGVRKPNHPDAPFPLPLRVIGWRTPGGHALRVETYVIAAHPAEGCPDYQYDDAPILYSDGVVIGTGWRFAERHWREFGGSLADLRATQQRHQCPESQAG